MARASSNSESLIIQKWLIEEVEPTPEKEVTEGIVMQLDKLREKYEESFEGDRGAKLRITVSPPETSTNK